jgi:hypothetical protein
VIFPVVPTEANPFHKFAGFLRPALPAQTMETLIAEVLEPLEAAPTDRGSFLGRHSRQKSLGYALGHALLELVQSFAKFPGAGQVFSS